MFEAISDTTKIQSKDPIPKILEQPASEVEKNKSQPKHEFKNVQETKNDKKNKPQVSEILLEDLGQDFKMIHNVDLKFTKHESTGRTMVKVINKDTKKLIREIPSEQVLNLAAKIDEMVGMLFDKIA